MSLAQRLVKSAALLWLRRYCKLYLWNYFRHSTIWLTAVEICEEAQVFLKLNLLTNHSRLVLDVQIIMLLVNNLRAVSIRRERQWPFARWWTTNHSAGEEIASIASSQITCKPTHKPLWRSVDARNVYLCEGRDKGGRQGVKFTPMAKTWKTAEVFSIKKAV